MFYTNLLRTDGDNVFVLVDAVSKKKKRKKKWHNAKALSIYKDRKKQTDSLKNTNLH